MVTTATTDDLFNNNAKTLFSLVQLTSITAGSQIIFGDNAGNEFFAYVTSAGIPTIFHRRSGGFDTLAWGAAIAAGSKYILESNHDGTNITINSNGGTATSAASGNTSNLARPMQISGVGASTSMLNGKITTILTDDSVWTADQRARVRSCLGQAQGISF
jgi:hypothetical protein